jgi:hypothetical protein
MNQQKIFIVSGSFDSYDDKYTRIFKAFYSKEDAEKYAEKADRILKAMVTHINESRKIVSRSFSNMSDEEFTIFEKTEEYNIALNMYCAHPELSEFNHCYIEEITIL